MCKWYFANIKYENQSTLKTSFKFYETNSIFNKCITIFFKQDHKFFYIKLFLYGSPRNFRKWKCTNLALWFLETSFWPWALVISFSIATERQNTQVPLRVVVTWHKFRTHSDFLPSFFLMLLILHSSQSESCRPFMSKWSYNEDTGKLQRCPAVRTAIKTHLPYTCQLTLRLVRTVEQLFSTHEKFSKVFPWHKLCFIFVH